MADRAVKVTLTAAVNAYLAEMSKAQKQTKKTAEESAALKAKLEAQNKIFDLAGKGSISSYLTAMEASARMTRETASMSEKLTARLEAQQAAFRKTGTVYVAAGGLIAAGLALAAKKAADFDAQMAQVKTLSGASETQMRGLHDAALTLGQGMGQSATQVADAETELVKAGVSVKDQLGGALKGTLALAAAGQMDVADATQIAASAMTQFKLKGKDVPHIADLLAAGADKALGSVQDLGQGLKFIGPVSQSMGVSIDQTVGALALLANNGILAEQAGTGLRGMMMSLTAPSALAAKTMDKYGISMFDAKGKFIGFDGAAQQLKDHLGGLDQATRSQALGQIFGNEQITTATVLMQGGAKAVDDMTKAVNDQGFAVGQASGKLDSLKGDLSKLKAALDSALISTGESSQGPLRGVTQSITGLVNGYNQMPEAGKTAAFWVAAVGAAVTASGGAALLAAPKIVAYRAAMADLGGTGKVAKAGLSGVASFLGGPWGLALTAGTVAVGQFIDAQARAAERTQQLAASLDQATGSITDDSRKTVAAALAAKGSFLWMQTSSVYDDAKKLGLSIQTVTNAAMGNADAMRLVKDRTDLATNAAGRGAGVAATNADAARNVRDAVRDWAGSLADAQSQQEQTNQAVDAGAASTDSAASSVAQLGLKASLTKDEISGLADQLRGLGDATMSERDAARQYEAAIDAATEAAQRNGKTLDINTAKGRENQAAVDAVSQAVKNHAATVATQTGDQLRANKVISDGRSQLIKTLGQFGITGKAAQAYADKLGLIPLSKETVVKLRGLQQAEQALNALTRDRVVNIIARSKLPDLNGAASGTGRGGTYATGGKVVGPGTGTSDSIYARLSNGEFVTTAAATARNIAALQFINNGGVIPGFAGGGLVAANLAIAHSEIPGYAGGGLVTAERQKLINRLLSITAGGVTAAEQKQLTNLLLTAASKTPGARGSREAADAHRFEKSFASLAKSADAASSKLKDLKDKAKDAASTVSQAVRAFFNVSDLAKGTTSVSSRTTLNGVSLTGYTNAPTAGSIRSALGTDAARIKAYAAKLSRLAKKGLTGALVGEIAGLGLEGEPIVDALLTATSADVKDINSSYAAIGKYSDQAGKAASDAEYKAMITSAQKNADKINSQIKAQTDRLIKELTSALRGAPRRAGGGPIMGPGTSTSDSVLLWGSDGEYVMTAAAYARNRAAVEAMNRGATIRGYASGGRIAGYGASTFVQPVYANNNQSNTVVVREVPTHVTVMDRQGVLVDRMKVVASDVASGVVATAARDTVRAVQRGKRK